MEYVMQFVIFDAHINHMDFTTTNMWPREQHTHHNHFTILFEIWDSCTFTLLLYFVRVTMVITKLLYLGFNMKTDSTQKINKER